MFLLLWRLSNAGRALSAVSVTRLCAAVIQLLPQLCAARPSSCMLSDEVVDRLVKQSAVSRLTNLDIRLVVSVMSSWTPSVFMSLFLMVISFIVTFVNILVGLLKLMINYSINRFKNSSINFFIKI